MNRYWLTAITIALLVAACSGTTTETVTVTFDGDGCGYNGPGGFDVDTELTIDLVNETESSFGLGVWKVPDGTSADDIETQGMLVVGGSMSQNMRGISSPGSVSGRTLVVMLNETGTWALNCFQETTPPGVDYPAAIVEVR